MTTDNKFHVELLSAEMLARSIIEQAGEAIIVCDEEGRIIRASRLAHVLCGENLLLKPFNDLFRLHITETECLFSVFTPLHGGSFESAEVEFEQNDGQIYHLLLNATPLKSAQDQIIGCILTLADITERRQAEEELRKSEEKYRSLFDSLIEGFCIIEVLFDANNHPIDYCFLEINPVFEAQTGLHNVQGKLMREHAPKHEPYWLEIYGKVALTGNSIRFVYEKNALNRWYDVSAYRVGGQDSRKVAILFNDITAVKKAEVALKASEERLALALEGGRMGLWEWDTRTDRSVWNNTGYQLLGLPVGDGSEAKNLFFDRVHPDDIGPINRILANVMKHGDDFYHEFRITRADDGQEHWLAAAGRLFRNAAGQPVKMIGVNFDVTARKHAEQELKQLNEELENRVAERTKELAATVKKLRVEVAERENAEERVLRLNRLYKVVSETSQVIIRTMDRETIFNEFCRIAVEDGKFKLAWVGQVDEESGELMRIVAANGATGYLDDIKITANEEPAGIGPADISVREGAYYISTDLLGAPITRPWYERGRAHGIRASASVALKQEGEVIGALTLYADKKDFFDRQQTKLLSQMGADVSFALDNIVRETRRKEAELALRDETTERLRIVEALREKEQMLINQSRQAAMGEMIGNIAHQWRQPLNTLGLKIQQLLLFYDMDGFTREFLEQSVGKSMQLIQHMSKTIDDFRNYFRPDKEKVEFKVQEAIAGTLTLIEDSFKSRHIGFELVTKGDPVIHGFRNEFAQVVLNILNNARDVLMEREIKDPKVTITIGSENDRAVVIIADNAGGVPEEIMGKIFDPYFTTKGPQSGTGVGLFMSKTIIESNMGGRLSVRNHGNGAEFRIEV